MGGLGKEFRRLRDAKGVTLDQVATATKVGIHHLKALEGGDFSTLPGDVFVRGYVRAYAEFLGANPDKLLDLYRRDREGSELELPQVAERTVQEMSRLLGGASARTSKRGGLALRIKFDGIGKLAWQVGVVVAAVAGIAALAVVLMRPHEGESVQQLMAGDLSASRSHATVSKSPVTLTVPSTAAVEGSTAAVSPPTTKDPSTSEIETDGGPSAPTSDASLSAETSPTTATQSSRLPALPPAPAPIEQARAPAREDRIAVPEHGLGTHVDGGQLSGQAASFEEGSTVWFWTRIDSAEPGQTVRHVWLRDDREVHGVDLKVGSAQWRTWSRKTMRPGSAGHWTVEVRDAYGRVLASDEFDCTPDR